MLTLLTMAFFLRKTHPRDPLTVDMTGIRMGERLLQVGADDDTLPGALAAKVGLSGESAMVVADAAAARVAQKAAERAGVLMPIHIGLAPLPYDPDHFDLAVVHSRRGLLSSLTASERGALLGEVRRVLRAGGRIIVFEAGEAHGLSKLLGGGGGDPESYRTAGGAEAPLRDAGFKPVRLLADRHGLRFVEGLKSSSQ